MSERLLTTESVMNELGVSDEEYDEMYSQMLRIVRAHGTFGAQTMLNHVRQELENGNETIG